MSKNKTVRNYRGFYVNVLEFQKLHLLTTLNLMQYFYFAYQKMYNFIFTYT